MKVALLQLTSSDDPAANLPVTLDLVAQAAAQGADLIATPEVTNCVSTNRSHQMSVLQPEAQDETLKALRQAAQDHGRHILIGSLALRTDDPDGRFANRSFLIAPEGQIAARYDKIHMFDVQVSDTETYRESAGYRPGTRAVLTGTPWAKLGLTICYDLRFPHLYRHLAQAGAQIITIPSAFSPVTGAAHWEPLLRARAIETGCFILAPAQTGTHPAQSGRSRKTHGHSMVIAPWGEILMDAGTEPGLYITDIDPGDVAKARSRVPSLMADQPWDGP